MNNQDPITHFLMRADNLAIALETQRALDTLQKQGLDNLSKPVARILSDPENLRIAQAISRRIKPIKKELQCSFGAALHRQLEKLSVNDLNNRWKLGKTSKEWTKPYAGSSFLYIPESEKDDAPCLFVSIHRTNDFINLGISASENKELRGEYWQLQSVSALKTHLKKNGYKSHHQWWLGFKHLYNLYGDELYLTMTGNIDEVVQEAADATWKLFNETREMIEKANRDLAEFHNRDS